MQPIHTLTGRREQLTGVEEPKLPVPRPVDRVCVLAHQLGWREPLRLCARRLGQERVPGEEYARLKTKELGRQVAAAREAGGVGVHDEHKLVVRQLPAKGGAKDGAVYIQVAVVLYMA